MNFIEVPSQVYSAITNGDFEGFIAAGLFLSGLSGFFSLYMQFRMDKWLTTTGVLKLSDSQQLGSSAIASDRKYTHKLSYTYEVNGITYTGTELSPWKVVTNSAALLQHIQPNPETDEVKVIYNPRHPSHTYLKRCGTISKLITMTISFILISVPWMIFS